MIIVSRQLRSYSEVSVGKFVRSHTWQLLTTSTTPWKGVPPASRISLFITPHRYIFASGKRITLACGNILTVISTDVRVLFHTISPSSHSDYYSAACTELGVDLRLELEKPVNIFEEPHMHDRPLSTMKPTHTTYGSTLRRCYGVERLRVMFSNKSCIPTWHHSKSSFNRSQSWDIVTFTVSLRLKLSSCPLIAKSPVSTSFKPWE